MNTIKLCTPPGHQPAVAAVRRGLAASRQHVACSGLLDDREAQRFEAITRLPVDGCPQVARHVFVRDG